MSDIYLQITETPTVVTLSAPVISGALSSTVTVANTVTVALDANSLSALENVTVTVGAAITGTVTVSNFPATQAVSLSSVPTHGVTLASTTVTVSSIPAISGTVTVGNTVTIAGTVTANPTGTQTIAGTVTANVLGTNGSGAIIPLQMAYSEETFANGNRLAVSIVNSEGYEYTTPLPISGTVTANVNGVPNDNGIPYFGVGYFSSPGSSLIQVSQDPNCGLPINGTVTANLGSALPAGTNRIGVVTIGAGTVTIGAGAAQIGSVTASISNFPATQAVSLTTLPALVAGTAQIGSVTASISANPSGALTTRFGSVTTANTAQITTAVTNTSRKYLFAQNISIGSVTMGIGFSPTTTQGIQLSAGSGIVFDSFCPTGAVYWLGATTGAAWSILEG
jgi:hypothetical protein